MGKSCISKSGQNAIVVNAALSAALILVAAAYAATKAPANLKSEKDSNNPVTRIIKKFSDMDGVDLKDRITQAAAVALVAAIAVYVAVTFQTPMKIRCK